MSHLKTRPKGATRYIETAFGILPRNKLIELEAEGMAKGLVWVIHNAPKRPQITTELLLKLHHLCFGSIFPDWAGTLRKVEVQISQHVPPASHKLREFLYKFERDLSMQLTSMDGKDKAQREKIIEIAAWMQHKIVWIHPFLDYNGRIARLVTNLLFLEYGFPLVEIPAEKSGKIRNLYVKGMQSGDKGNLSDLQKLLWKALKTSQ